MANEDLGFNVFALDKASRTFIRLSERIEKVSDKLDELDRKRANPEINLDVDEDKVRGAVGAFADAADDEARRRKGGFFAAMFTPSPAVLRTLRTGIPAALSSPIGTAALVLGGLFAASFASAVITSGAFAVVGGGFTALAAVALKENERIKASFADLAQTAQLGLMQAVQPMVPAFDQALSRVGRMFGDHIQAPLEDIFAGLAPTIVSFADSAVRTVGNILGSLATPEFITGMQTVLGEISRQLPRLGQSIGDMFLDLARNADDIAEAFGHVVTVVSGLIDFAGRLLNSFTDLFNLLSDFGGVIDFAIITPLQKADQLIKQMAGTDEGKKTWEILGEGLRGIGVPESLLLTDPPPTGAMEKHAAEIAGLARRAEEAAREGLAELQEREEQLDRAMDTTSEQISHQEDKLQQLKDSMFATAEGVLGLRDSTRTYEEALDNANEVLERNGVTLDVNTEKGRANQAAIDEIASSALEHIQAMIEQGESTEKVTKFTQQARDEFIKAARAAGLEKDEAKALADQLGLVPSQVETKIKAIDEMSDTINHLKRQMRELQRLAGIVPINATVGSFFGSAHVVPRGHSGGMIVPEGVRRLHAGGGLGHGERMIIAQTGEFVVQRSAAQALGPDNLRQINQGRLPDDGSSGGITVENMNVQAWTGRFSLRQIEQELSMHGAA